MYPNLETEPQSRIALAPGEFPQFVVRCAAQYWQECMSGDVPADFYYFSPSGRSGPGSAHDAALQRLGSSRRALEDALMLDENGLEQATQEFNQQLLKSLLSKRSHNRQLLSAAKAWESPSQEDEAFRDYMIGKIDDPADENVCGVIAERRVNESGYIHHLTARVSEAEITVHKVDNIYQERQEFMKRIKTTLKGI